MVSADHKDRNVLEQAKFYRESGRIADAAKLFLSCADACCDDEEKWYAYLQAARCLKELGDDAGFLRYAFAAFLQLSHRAEPLYHVARFYRERSMYTESVIFAEAGLALPR